MGAKDITEKVLADYNDVFADIANVLLFQGEQIISPDSLINERTISQYKSSNARLHQQERDILKSWTEGNIKIALIGFENQTEPEKQMPVRIIGYEGADYRSQLGSDQIVPVVSVILYFGTKHRWNHPKTLQSLMNIPKQLKQYVNDCHIQVFEIAWLSDEVIDRFQSDFGIVARYFSEKRKYKDYIPNDTRTIRHVDEVLKLLSVMSGDDRYEKILTFSNEKSEVGTMCDVAQRLEDKGRAEGLVAGRKEGLVAGRIEGRTEGQIETLVTLVKSDTITVDTAAGVLKVTVEEFKKYLK